MFGKNVTGKMVAPAQQRHFEFQARRAARAGKHYMIRTAVFKTVSGNDRELVADFAKPKPRRVEHVRPKIVENAGTLVAPFGIADQTRGSIPVEHAAAID